MPMQRRGARQVRRARLVATLAVTALVLVAASCSSDSGNDSAGTTASSSRPTTSASSTSTSQAEDPYPDFTPSMYAGTETWLCHPDVARAECTDQPETVVKPDRSLSE